MGFAIAAEAMRRGAEVTLVAGPSAVDAPAVRELVRVRSAEEMHEAVIERAPTPMDVAIMAAAVADYAPAERAAQKMPKGDDTITLVLKKTPDILGELGTRRLASGRGPLLVGFAAETEDVVARATAKREQEARRSHRGQRRLARRRGVRRRHERRHRDRSRGRAGAAAPDQSARRVRDSRSRGSAAAKPTSGK